MSEAMQGDQGDGSHMEAVPIVAYTDKKGRACSAFMFEPTADYSRGHIAFNASLIDAVVVQINPDANENKGEMPFRCCTFAYPGAIEHDDSTPLYWMVPLSYKNDWFLHGPRVIAPQAMLSYLSAQMNLTRTKKKP